MNSASALRIPGLIVATLLINALIFGAIQYMVVNRTMNLTDVTDFDIANFIRMQEQSREVSRRRNPKAPSKPDAEQQQDLSRLSNTAATGTVGALALSVPQVDIDIDTGSAIQIARELTPLVRIPPIYPERALQLRQEGYVTLRFTVTETGAVADPEVIASDPPGYFDRAAIRAVLRWKYQPQLADGKPISVITYTRLKFELAGGEEGK